MVHRKLGFYIIVLALLQLTFYIGITFFGDCLGFANLVAVMLLLNPRVGLMIEWLILPETMHFFPGILSWLSVFALLYAGYSLMWQKNWLKKYLVTETILATPTALLLLYGAIVRLPQGNSGGLVHVVVLFSIFTVIPVTVAMRRLKRSADPFRDSATETPR